jgi:hypothetical protein
LVNDLQWRYTVNEVKRTYSKDITKITGLIFIVGIAAFAAAVFGIALISKWHPGVRDAAQLLLAGLAGGWGAGFSMLASLKGRMDAADLNDLKLMKSRWILWSRPLIGVGAACILYSSSSLDCSAGPHSQRSSLIRHRARRARARLLRPAARV